MDNVRIRRLTDDPQGAVAVIEPDSKRWQLIVDNKGVPHLYVQVKVEDDEGGLVDGWFCIEHMLPTSIDDLMNGGSFGGKLPPEEEAAAAAEWAANPGPAPCPRY